MSLYPPNLASLMSTESIFASSPCSSSIISAPTTLTFTMQPTSSGSYDSTIMSSGSLSSAHVCGTKP